MSKTFTWHIDKALAASTSAQTVSIDLPRTGLLTNLSIKIDTRDPAGVLTTLGVAGTILVDPVQLVCDGRVIFSFSQAAAGTAGEAQSVSKVDTGTTAPSVGASSTTPSWEFNYVCGRGYPYINDPHMVVPLQGYSNCMLTFQVTTSQSSAAQMIHVEGTEIQGESAKGRYLRTIGRVGSVASADNLLSNVLLPRLGKLRRIYINSKTDANVNGANLKLKHNSGQYVPVNARWDSLVSRNIYFYNFDDASIPLAQASGKFVTIDFDTNDDLASLENLLEYDRSELEFTASTSTSGTTFILQENVFPIG